MAALLAICLKSNGLISRQKHRDFSGTGIPEATSFHSSPHSAELRHSQQKCTLLRIATPDLRPRTATVRATLIIPRYQAVDAALYQTARAFRFAGTALVVLGAVLDLEPIVTASNPPAPIHCSGFGLGDGPDRRARGRLYGCRRRRLCRAKVLAPLLVAWCLASAAASPATGRANKPARQSMTGWPTPNSPT